MAGEVIGVGSELWLHNGTALVKLAGVVSITPPDPTIDEVEVTDLDATDRYRKFIPTMRDPGTITAVLNYVGGSATDTLILAARAAADERDWEVVFADADGAGLRKYSGVGFVKRYSPPEISIEGVQQSTLEIRVSGAITEEAA